MFKRPIPSILALVLLGAVLAPAVAQAGIAVPQDRVLGIRLTQTGGGGLTVDFDVTVFYTTGVPQTYGSSPYSAYYYARIGTSSNYFPQVDFGDGNSVTYSEGPYTYGRIPFASVTTVNGTPARAYRGSFSYTYGAPGSYTLSSTTNCCPPDSYEANLETGYTTTATFMSTFFDITFTTTTTRVKNTLTVDLLNPGFSKVFDPNPTGVGVPSTLTFTIDNTASTTADDDLAFTDNLPMGLVVAPMANVTNTCTGGTVTAVPGTATIDYMGGRVEAGETCTVSVDVVAAAPGDYVNTSGDLTTARGNSGPATDTLTVAATPPAFDKTFSPNPASVSGVSTLTFTIDNTANAVPATALDFTDDLPMGLSVADPANVMNTCTGGTVTATAGTGTISYSGGTVGAGSSCTISVDVTGDAVGPYENISGNLTSSLGDSGPATDTLVLVMAPTFAKSFGETTVFPGSVVTLTFTIDNSENPAPATGLTFTDNLPDGIVVATPPNAMNGCGGMLMADAGDSVISLGNGVVGAMAVCTIDVDVLVTGSGDLFNDAGFLDSDVGSSPAAAVAALSALADIPVLSSKSLALLALLLAMAGFLVIRRSIF